MEEITFIALSGLAPQVVTEAAWALARQRVPALVPRSVEAIATGAGVAAGRAHLLGVEAFDPGTGRPVVGGAPRWAAFCMEVYGREVPLRFHTPAVDGQPLADITGVEADRQYADLCYRLVARHTRAGSPPLVGSLAGGRKTMGAHLMAAFVVYARPEDRLVHVLVHPPSAESDPTFFYPHPGSEARVHLVDVPFPRLRTVLSTSALAGVVREEGDLREWLTALHPHLQAETHPDELSLTLGGSGGELVARLNSDDLARVRLTPAEAATLLVFAESIGAGSGTVRLDLLVGSQHVEQLRADTLSACGRFTPLRPWDGAADVSKAVSRTNATLAGSPLLARYLSVESDIGAEATFYRWAEPPPCLLRVVFVTAPTSWGI